MPNKSTNSVTENLNSAFLCCQKDATVQIPTNNLALSSTI